MRIGEASDASGVPERMIRHYEKLGLMPTATRRASGYREYADGDVARLRIIRLARDVGVPFEAIVDVMAGLGDPNAAPGARRRLGELVREKRDALAALMRELDRLGPAQERAGSA